MVRAVLVVVSVQMVQVPGELRRRPKVPCVDEGIGQRCQVGHVLGPAVPGDGADGERFIQLLGHVVGREGVLEGQGELVPAVEVDAGLVSGPELELVNVHARNGSRDDEALDLGGASKIV
jgi:hypothetical protein